MAGVNAWGGKREGAGRPPLSPSPTVRLTITLPAPLADQLRQLGDGNASAGVRRVFEQTQTHGGSPLAPGWRLSVNLLDEHRARLAVYDDTLECVGEYECFGSSDQQGANIQVIARRAPGDQTGTNVGQANGTYDA